jgi:3-hydroxyisobutyrate dehydrogenase-like beta-hydroxyacid dehydrogenase
MSDPRLIVVTEEAERMMTQAGVTAEELDDLYRDTSGGAPTLSNYAQVVVDRDAEQTTIWRLGEGEA